MKLVNTLYNLEFDLMENQILVLSIENHLAYRNILEELWKQYKGETGNFILSDGDKELKMSQRIECIYNIFNINTNDRKIISKISLWFESFVDLKSYKTKYIIMQIP